MKTLSTLVVALLLAACSTNGGGGSPDTVAPTDLGTVDATADDVAGGPDPSFVFEERGSDEVFVDDPVVEEVATLYRTPEQLPDLDVRSLLWTHDTLWVGTASGLFVYDAEEDRFVRRTLSGGDLPVLDLASGGAADLVLAHPDGVTRVDLAADTDTYTSLGAGVRCVAVGDDDVWVGGDSGAGALDAAGTWALQDTTHAVRDLVFPTGWDGVVGATEAGLLLFPSTGEAEPLTPAADWLCDDDVRALADVGFGEILVGSATGYARVQLGAAAERFVPASGANQLPVGAMTAVAARDGSFAFGHPVGASVRHAESPYAGHYDHYHSLRWLPDDEVRAVALAPEGALWVGTAAGLARIDRVARTLAEKAARLEADLDAYYWRLGGFVSSNVTFPEAWSDEGPARAKSSNNDGLWTQMQIGAWALAHGATGDEHYCDQARRAIANMFLLVDVPARDFEAAGLGRGYVARSVIRDDEGDLFAGCAEKEEWHLVTDVDGHDYYWKDDTSSDEIAGHFFGYPLFFDLCATEQERAEVADHAGAIAATIREAGFRLLDLDGEQTTFGRWHPELLAVAVDGLEACLAEGHSLEDCALSYGGGGWLNGAEILGTMLAAFHMTGDVAFYEAYETLVTEHRYGELVDFSENVVTVTDPSVQNHSDHELAMLAYFTLIRYEPNPVRRQRWIASMLAVYEHLRPERHGLWGLLVASATRDQADIEATVRTLHEIPLDLRRMPYDKSHREDLSFVGLDRLGHPQSDRALPYDENRTFWWNANPYTLTDDGDTARRRGPMAWLLPYWGLRYFGAIE